MRSLPFGFLMFFSLTPREVIGCRESVEQERPNVDRSIMALFAARDVRPLGRQQLSASTDTRGRSCPIVQVDMRVLVVVDLCAHDIGSRQDHVIRHKWGAIVYYAAPDLVQAQMVP
jgi:hypothetical protein